MRHYDGQEINSGEHITVTLAKPDCPNAKVKKMQKYQQRHQGQSKCNNSDNITDTYFSATNAVHVLWYQSSVHAKATGTVPASSGPNDKSGLVSPTKTASLM